MLDKGLIHVYTGDGKGKTTAAFGLALRAAGQGLNVLIWQFLKPAGLDVGERRSLENIDNITLHILAHDWNMRKSLDDPETVESVGLEIKKVLSETEIHAKNRDFDLIILDEIVFCINKGLAGMEDIKRIVNSRDGHVELVFTGRYASSELIEMADLVTEMKPHKHPFDKGIIGRRGIEF